MKKSQKPTNGHSILTSSRYCIILITLLIKLSNEQNIHGGSEYHQSESMDLYRSFEQIVTTKGYEFEEHFVVTPDEVILRLFRIPGTKNEIKECKDSGENILNKSVVYLQHGFQDSADGWIAHRERFASVYVLSRAGYDVWLGNARGNKYSRNTTRPTLDNKFWDYSNEEIADIDIPTSIDYILNITQQKKLAIVAHSQGTAQLFYGLWHNEEYFAQRVSIIMMLGTASRLNTMLSPILQLQANPIIQKIQQTIFKMADIHEIMHKSSETALMKFGCVNLTFFCNEMVKYMDNENPELNDQERQKVMYSHYPAGSSIKQYSYIFQLIRSDEFRTYDYGAQQNFLKYGQEKPPIIDISKISKVPIAMFSGTKDILSDIKSTRWAASQLTKSLVFNREYELGHSSFLVGKDYSFFTKDLMNLMQKYHPVRDQCPEIDTVADSFLN
ncbi:ab-hydrolase associated lipase region family protein [Stylonychia lemnae]|uniref:Ab-hydrolase associated lipase region family protein n=1 Tax=Stylonychia lemnae TaxID=5949 RepID=A0A078A2B2_STYLE|nr:ab-hydrolase associated lipase region family protein [Stylonychia lemnae]|eukprot:CDW76275.1 ab-hydrolase associated lipase region family protein [Stylonychia lemnae]